MSMLLQATEAVAETTEQTMGLGELFLAGGWLMWPLLLLGGVTIFIFCERFWAIKQASRMDVNFMNRIRDLVRKYDLFLFSDEVYREFIYTGSPYISACHLEGIEQNVVLIDSVSKRYSECGIRIGALITKNRTLRNAVMKFCQARLSPPLLGQIVAEASIDAPRSYSTEVYEEYIERRKCLIDGLNRIPGVYSPIPMGAFYTVARLPVEDSDDFCAWCLSEFEYESETVMLAPASGFYSDPARGRNEVRIAYVLRKEDLERALVILAKALEAYNSRQR